MQGSLNEGVELDNEILDSDREAGKVLDQQLFEEVVPGETPELAPELDILGMVSKIRDLDYAQINLQNIGGMNQDLALEMHSLVPSLISDDVPLGFYTKGITKTRYNFALEAVAEEKKTVGARIKDAFQKLIAWIREQLDKMVELFRSRFEGLLKKTPPPPKEIGGADRRPIYVRAFGQADGDKLAEVLKDALESRDQRIQEVKSHFAKDFYFVSIYKQTPFFNDFVHFLQTLMKDSATVAIESDKFKNYLVNGTDVDKQKESLKNVAQASEGLLDFFRESARTYPENNNGKHEEFLSDSEIQGLTYEKAYAVFETAEKSIIRYCEPLISITKKIESTLAEIEKAMASSDGSVTTEIERLFTTLMRNHASACREALKDINRWMTVAIESAQRFAGVYKSDTFETQESRACEKLGLDFKKLS